MKLSPMFTSGAVLPANKPIKIFGVGKGACTVEFANIRKEIVSENDTWCTEFPAMEYGGPYTLVFENEEERVILNDIYVGEVYLCFGQSNMAFMLKSSNTKKEYYRENEKLRLFAVTLDGDGEESWKTARFGVIESYSALGYLIGDEISRSKNIHVGIIACTMGASSIRSWLPKGVLQKLNIEVAPEKLHADHRGEYGAWNGEGYLYERKLSKVIPYSISGAVWYQGESNAAEGEAVYYDRELIELIRTYREDFGTSTLPFTVVQLADTYERMEDPGWKIVQDKQAEVADTTENTYLVISRDISENDDIHPMSKYGLAMRIADIIKAHYFN